MPDQTGVKDDVWSNWLLHHRHGDDGEFAGVVQADVGRFVDHVLDAAELVPGMTLVDIGTGEGILGLRAIERVGCTLKVLFTDVSDALLAHAQSQACARDVQDQCTFIRCSADALPAIADGTVDVVAMRAVLAYVADKKAALSEFYRILKPGGRLSLSEPVLQDDAFLAAALRIQVESQSSKSVGSFLPLLHRWKAAQYPDTPEKIASSPIANYSERTLFESMRVAGFRGIHLELHIDLLPNPIRSWDVFLRTSPHPLAPTLQTILHERFTVEERVEFERTMRPSVEGSDSVIIARCIYASAVKPG
jgi:arsenite methyltransferase